MRGAFAGLCLALVAAERGARLCSIIRYLLHGQLGWLGVTVGCVVPGYAAQLLSILWFRADGHPLGCWLLVLHLLQLGLWKRYWDVFQMAAKPGVCAHAREVLIQYGDVCVLRLLEALLQTLPYLLLQAYVIVAVDPAGVIPGVSAGLSLLSLSWALVSYSHFSCLLKPGHLCLPAPAILCLLIWRTGMLGTRILALVLFARLYSFWVLAVAVLSSCRCPLVAHVLLVGGPADRHHGPSLPLEAVQCPGGSCVHLLLHKCPAQSLQAQGDRILYSAAALVVYYSLLHPKSTEICQGFRETTCSAASAGDDKVAGDSSQTRQSLGISGDRESSAGEVTIADPKSRNSSSLLQFRVCLENSWMNHHHWLLVKLALKTGDMSAISAAFGDSGVGEAYLRGWLVSKPGANLSLPVRELDPRGVQSVLTGVKLLSEGKEGSDKPSTSPAGRAREDGAGQDPAFPPAKSFPSSFSPDLAEGSSIYFSASAGGITGTAMATGTALGQRDSKDQPPAGCLGGGGGGMDLSLGMASISPILGTCAHKHLWISSSHGSTGGCGVRGPPKECVEPTGMEGTFVGWHHLQDTRPYGMKGTGVRSKLRPPCFTSTPKANARSLQQGLEGLGEGTDLSEPMD
ncbi:XK-related protein 5 isoform X2 [Colius striatus]|uniref:XK-related protein 5 isoform X2 n=1 Tax=Colius striatus TaxID=57412 RepID=UPI002B1D841B|nr:XK-related protein 5 isoform X2 [Colius striatus]